ERLRMVSGDTGRSPDEGTTAGSMSVEMSGTSVRLVCAEVRKRFLDHAAAVLGCDPDELSVVDGRILRGGESTQFDYWALGGEVRLVRAGNFLAIVCAEEASLTMAVEAARRHCAWDGGTAIPPDAGEPGFLMAAPSRDRVVETGVGTGGEPRRRVIEAVYSRP